MIRNVRTALAVAMVPIIGIGIGYGLIASPELAAMSVAVGLYVAVMHHITGKVETCDESRNRASRQAAQASRSVVPVGHAADPASGHTTGSATPGRPGRYTGTRRTAPPRTSVRAGCVASREPTRGTTSRP